MELKETSKVIRRVIGGENLDAEEAKEAFLTIMREDREGYFYLAFLVALATKGETADELFGLYQATAELCPRIESGLPSDKLIDVSGTGGSRLKTINVSTASAFIGAAGGLYVAKQAARKITSPTGSADLFEAFGINVYELKPEQIVGALREVGIAPLYYPAFAPELRQARIGLSGRIFREAGLAVRTPIHLFAFAFHPVVEVRRRVYGVMDFEYAEKIVGLFEKAGYVRGMIVHGSGGLAEVSTIGETQSIEFCAGGVVRRAISPEEIGVKIAESREIATVDAEGNIKDFLRVIYGAENGAKSEIVFANAGVMFYVMRMTRDIASGVRMARDIVNAGGAREKLEALVGALGDNNRLNYWKRQAEVLNG